MKRALILTWVSLGALALASCNSPVAAVTGGGSAVGPNGEIADGTYAGSNATCDGAARGSAPPTLVVSGLGGTFSGGNSSGTCHTSGTITLTYPNTSLITVDPIATADSPAGCSGETFPADQGTLDGTFTSSGSTLTITFTNSSCGSGGGSTHTEVDTWTKQ